MRTLSDNTIDPEVLKTVQRQAVDIDTRLSTRITVLREDMNYRDRLHTIALVIIAVIELVRLFF